MSKEVFVRFCKDWSQLHYLMDMYLFILEVLKLKNRDFHSLQNGLTPQQQKELNSLLSDPKKIQQLVNSPELNSLLNKIR